MYSKADGKVPEEIQSTFERPEKPQNKQFKNGGMEADILCKMTNWSPQGASLCFKPVGNKINVSMETLFQLKDILP